MTAIGASLSASTGEPFAVAHASNSAIESEGGSMVKNVQPSASAEQHGARTKTAIVMVALALGFGLGSCSGGGTTDGGTDGTTCVLGQSKIDLCTVR